MKPTRALIEAELKHPIADQENFLIDAYTEYVSASAPARAELRAWRTAKDKGRKVREKIFELLTAQTELAHLIICERLRFCERVNSHLVDVVFELCLLLLEYKIGAAEFGKNSQLKLGVYLVRTDLLKQFCNC